MIFFFTCRNMLTHIYFRKASSRTDRSRYRVTVQNICGSQWNLREEGQEGLQEPEDSRAPKEHGPHNLLSRPFKGSERLTWQSQSLYDSALGSLHICYGCADSFARSRFPPTTLSDLVLICVFVPLLAVTFYDVFNLFPLMPALF